ncbi:MAG: PIG-L deacetylase family protein [Promethearchaeota archaeon]
MNDLFQSNEKTIPTTKSTTNSKKQQKTILAIGAHPDDIEIGCGATLAKHKMRGDIVHGLILTGGGQHGNPLIRESEVRRAASIVGIKSLSFADLEDTYIFENLRATILAIEALIEQINPDVIYSHSEHDRHQDHIGAFLATRVACRRTPQVLLYETPSILPTFSPQIFVNVEDTIEKKLDAIRVYASQSSSYYMECDLVEGLAKVRGYSQNVRFCEAFELLWMVKW